MHRADHRLRAQAGVQERFPSVRRDASAPPGAAAGVELAGQYLRRCAERGGVFWEYTRGIALGSPLSPLIGAFFLKALDQRMERLGLFYIRFMDDILVLAPTRWRLPAQVSESSS